MKGGRRERKRKIHNIHLTLLFEPVPGMSVLPHSLWGKVWNVQCGFQSFSDLAQLHLSPCLHTMAHAGAPAQMSSSPHLYFQPNPFQVMHSLKVAWGSWQNSLYKECIIWLFLNLVVLWKHLCNETKKIVFIRRHMGKTGWTDKAASGEKWSQDEDWTLFPECLACEQASC